MNKKAISPLIATVLLIAFAVALGTMIVSYILEVTRYDPCAEVIINFEDKVCYNGKTVSFIITNSGSEPISSLHSKFISQNKDPVNMPFMNSLNSGDASKLDVEFTTLNPSGVTLTVTPKVMVDGKEKFCSQAELKTKLETCN